MAARVEIDHAAVEELFADPVGPVAQIMEIAAYAVENRAKQLLLEPKSGQVFTTHWYTDREGHVQPYGHRAPHQASAPGEAPASDTGRLLSSIAHRLRTEDRIVADVYSDLHYAWYLELGHGLGRGGIDGYVEPRPFLRPALDAVSDI